MAFVAIKKDSGRSVEQLTASSTTITKGDALAFASGYVQRATSATTEVVLIAEEDVTTAGGAHTAINCTLTKGVAEFVADTDASTSQALVGTKRELVDHTSLSTTWTTGKVFLVTGIVGVAADKKVRGYFVSKDA